jgi:K+/H+ antiporter YhaU regulatory subunit KhtT
MTKPIKSKYPEKLVIRLRQIEASEELVEAWQTYNQARRFVEKYETEENYSQMAEALNNWQIKNNNLEKINQEINQFTNLKFYGKPKLNTLEKTH